MVETLIAASRNGSKAVDPAGLRASVRMHAEGCLAPSG